MLPCVSREREHEQLDAAGSPSLHVAWMKEQGTRVNMLALKRG